MKRILLLTATGLLLSLFGVAGASAFGVKDVLKMHEDGIADSLIIMKIDYSGKTFHLDADDMHELKAAGVSDEVISAMLRTEDQDAYGDGGYSGYGGYYHPYPYTRVFLGFGFHRHYSPYYGGYYFPRYRPYYTRPYPRDYGNYRYRGSYGYPQPRSGSPGTRYRRR